MRIVFVLPGSDLSGGTRVVGEYARRLACRGHDTLIVSVPPPEPSLQRKVKLLLTGHGWCRGVRKPSHLDNMDVAHRVLERCRPVRDADVPDADVVVATWWETAEWVMALSPSKGAKAHFIQGDDRVTLMHAPDLVRRAEATWQCPTRKIVVSNWVCEQVKSVGVTGPMDIVYNGVELGQFSSPQRDKNKRPTVGFVHSPLVCKGTDQVLKAISLARAKVPGLQIVSFGLEMPVAPLELPEGALFYQLPAPSELKHLYSRCDAWLFGSRAEGFGLPVLEAMACRTPVLAMPAGAAPELLAGGGGMLVSSQSPEAMADAVAQVAGMSNEEWRAMSQAAYATASRYSWDEATSLFEKSLKQAVTRAASCGVA